MTLLEVNNHATWKIVAPASSLHAVCDHHAPRKIAAPASNLHAECDDSPFENSSFAPLLGQFDCCCRRIPPGYCPAVGLLL